MSFDSQLAVIILSRKVRNTRTDNQEFMSDSNLKEQEMESCVTQRCRSIYDAGSDYVFSPAIATDFPSSLHVGHYIKVYIYSSSTSVFIRMRSDRVTGHET